MDCGNDVSFSGGIREVYSKFPQLHNLFNPQSLHLLEELQMLHDSEYNWTTSGAMVDNLEHIAYKFGLDKSILEGKELSYD